MQGILREIRATLKAYAAQSRDAVTGVHLCGGTSRLPGLPEQLSIDLGIAAQPLVLPQEVSSAIPYQNQPLAAQAYALALRGTVPASPAPRFNLRRGDFAFRRDADSLKSQLLRLGGFAAALLLFYLVFTLSRATLLGQREKEVDNQLCAITQRVLGHCEANYDRALNLLRGKESPTAAIPKYSAVTLLSELTNHVPQDVSVKFDQVVIDLERLTLRGETDSPHQIDTLSKALKDSPCFHEVNQGKVEKTRDGQHVSFRLDVQVRCPEQGARP
jgi:general secretion pathway protein L